MMGRPLRHRGITLSLMQERRRLLAARRLNAGLLVDKSDLDPHANRSRAIGAITDAATVPQVPINGGLIAGSTEIEAYRRKAA